MEHQVAILIGVMIRVLAAWGSFALAEHRNRSPWPWAICTFIIPLTLLVQAFVPKRKEVRA